MKRVLILLWIPLAFSCGKKGPGKPGILLIMADDLGWNQLGCYGGPYLTPYVDSLASEGMRFTNAYSSQLPFRKGKGWLYEGTIQERTLHWHYPHYHRGRIIILKINYLY